MRHPNYFLICFVVFFSAGMWGLYWLPQRLLLDAGMTGGWGTVAQYVISLAVLLPIAIWRILNGKQIGLRHWVCGLLLGSGAIFYANSLLVTEVIRALVFFYLTPLWATLIEITFLKRRLGWSRVGTVALALAGVWIAVGTEAGVPIPVYLGDWFGLLAGFLIAAGAARTEVEQPEGVFPLLFIVIVFALIATIYQYPMLSSKIGEVPSFEVAISSLPFLLGISLLFVLPTTAIIFWSPSKIGTGVFGILILSELVVGVISAALLTEETFGGPQAVGVTLIVAAGIVEVALNNKSKETTAKAT
ncbi:MAG: DMT family transporter [Rhodospirillales bacterium]|nr:DMT family transporter [Rhodospirillales bacterium]MBT4041395.1 DMT family transporter [Rhodospirillales bacterium]MBT4626084.1 DMT family transporter [Rhodospirillales bacterium]MBT5352733.1 DMT family transporter [Rhodospirillales bacterium]MBT5521179.1 DMT family transporter [Rhodospirillales bacterium]